MRERQLGNLAREAGALRNPISKATSESGAQSPRVPLSATPSKSHADRGRENSCRHPSAGPPELTQSSATTRIRWSRSAFILRAGMVHRPASKSISDQAANRTSPVRQAVNSISSAAHAPWPLCWRSFAIKLGSCCTEVPDGEPSSGPSTGSAGWHQCFRAMLRDLVPARSFLAVAQSRIWAMRLSTRVPVSVRPCQSGSTIDSTSYVSIEFVCPLPIAGSTYRASELRHCRSWSFDQAASWFLMNCSTAAAKVIASRLGRCRALRASIGSSPSSNDAAAPPPSHELPTMRQAETARAPFLGCAPCSVYLRYQDFDPAGPDL